MKSRSTLFFFRLVLCGAVLSLLAGFRPVNTDDRNVALAGYDPVAYHLQEKPVLGSPLFAMEWRNAVWRFSKSSHLRLFRKDPEKYAPQYGGYCSLCISAGNLTDFDPAQFELHEGKLYLFQDEATRKQWRDNPEAYITQGDDRFEAIAEERVAERS